MKNNINDNNCYNLVMSQNIISSLMINQIDEIISCYAIDKNGTLIEFGKISNIEVERSFDGSNQASITISPNEKGELFKITVPEKGDKVGGNDMNTNIFGNMFKNMQFGKLETNDIKYSMKGIAFKTTDGDYVCYNPNFTFTNVANMVMDIPIFAMPVSKDQIKVGDVIKHNDAWVIVNDVASSEIKVAKPWTKEIVSVIPETSIFGFSFCTKVINPFENFGTTATDDNPFGNILPFMLMSGGTKNSNDMLMMMLAFGGGKIDFSNPMMMYMLMGDNGNTNDMLMMMMLSGNNPFEQKHECKCGCNIGDYVATPNTSIDPCFGVDFDWTKFAPRDEININANAMDIETDK